MSLSYRDRLAYEDVPEPGLGDFMIVWSLIGGTVFTRFDGRRWRLVATQDTLGM